MLEVRANYVALETLQTSSRGSSTRSITATSSSVEEGRLKFKEKLCIFDSLLVPNS